jgi:hypothetical protein
VPARDVLPSIVLSYGGALHDTFVLGPSYMHYMYPNECHMVVMKGYVRNHAHPEGSMREGYTTEVVIKFYADYIKDGKLMGVPVS